MKASINQKLNQLIQHRGRIFHQELKLMAEGRYFGRPYRMSTIERELRPSRSPFVKTVEVNGSIREYSWVGTPARKQNYKVMGNNNEVLKMIQLPTV